MDKDRFVFNGDWTYEVVLPAFAVFQNRGGDYGGLSAGENRGKIRLEFEDDTNEDPDPSPEQFNTLHYIFDNQQQIVSTVLERTMEEMPSIINYCDLKHDENYRDMDVKKLQTLMGFGTITIHLTTKDSFAYYTVSGGGNWDEEHGFELLMHKNRVIRLGGIDGSSYWEALKDNGTYEEQKDNVHTSEKPRKYKPHPKYNKLKPSQVYANQSYEQDLISRRFNSEFIAGVEGGEIDINGKTESSGKTYLEAACWYNNNQIVSYLLSKNASVRYALHQCVGYNHNPEAFELLLKHGTSINTPGNTGSTVLFEIMNNVAAGLYSAVQNSRKNPGNITALEKAEQNLLDFKNRVQDLIRQGADPSVENIYGHSCFSIMRNADEASRNDLNAFLEECVNTGNR